MKRHIPPGLKLEVESAFAGPRHFVKVDCPEQEDAVQIAPCEIRLYIGLGDVETFFTFRCPGCGEAHSCTASEETIRQLSHVGVATFRIRNEPRSDGPPIGYDDLLDFAVALEGWDGEMP